MATHSSILAWRIPMDKGAWRATVLRVTEWDTTEQLTHTHTHTHSLPVRFLGFPGGSDGKESACNVGDPGLIPGLGSSPGEGIGYPLQYSWASLVAQLVKNPPAMWET